MDRGRKNAHEPPPLPTAPPPEPRAEREDGELSDDDLAYVVGGVSLEAHQFLESGAGPSQED